MSVLIPLLKQEVSDETYPHFDLQVPLDGVTYTFEFCWNTRESGWFMSILTEGGDPIISGVRVVVDFPLARRCADPRRPPGVLLAIDTTGKRLDPDLDGFGPRVVLMYITSAELPL